MNDENYALLKIHLKNTRGCTSEEKLYKINMFTY